MAQEVERQLGLTAARAEMKVGEKDRPETPGRIFGFCHASLIGSRAEQVCVLLAQILMSRA
jgi:hypothetical protein